MKSSLQNILYDILTLIVGSLLFSASVNMFIVPGKIILGGATGIASFTGRFWNVPIGTLIIAINIPLLLISTKLYGIGRLVKTVAGIAASSLATDFIPFPSQTHDAMICAILGGISMGAGTGLLLSRGYTTGGTDLASSIIRYKHKRMSAGKIIMILDLVIIASLTVVSGEYVVIIYSFVCTYAASTVTDTVIDGKDKAKSVFIISNEYESIADEICRSMSRGVTMLDGYGYFTKEKRSVLLCVIRKNELFKLKSLVKSIDNDAFVFFCDTSYVMGYGFKNE